MLKLITYNAKKLMLTYINNHTLRAKALDNVVIQPSSPKCASKLHISSNFLNKNFNIKYFKIKLAPYHKLLRYN